MIAVTTWRAGRALARFPAVGRRPLRDSGMLGLPIATGGRFHAASAGLAHQRRGAGRLNIIH